MRNKGFSLVELIIVIAIMAILIGVMAPQLIKYIEKTNISADTQLCDSVHTAIMTAANDPVVLTDSKSQEMLYGDGSNDGIRTPGADCRLDSYGSNSVWTNCAFAQAVTETLGFDVFTQGCRHYQHCKSTPAKTGGIICVVCDSDSDAFAVYISGSDRTGKKNGETYNGSYDDLEDSRVIFTK